MSDKADPLRALVVDTKKINREQLAAILQGKVLLDLQSNTFLLQPEAKSRGTARHAVLLSLLARKAICLLKEGDLDAPPDGLTPLELTSATGIRGNTIRPVVRRLNAEGLVMQVQGRYVVHNSAIGRVAIVLTEPEV